MRVIILLTMYVVISGCRQSAQPPDPEQFPPLEDEAKVDPREITFHNESVEMAELELFSPKKPIKDCKAEAPHRLLCPRDYRHILMERVYPRTKAKARYPKELPINCAQIWVRVSTKALEVDGHREAIFLLKSDKPLHLELEDGVTARLGQKGLGSPNQFPPPQKYCDATEPDNHLAPKERIRPESQRAKFAMDAAETLKPCCIDNTLCRRPLQATLTLKRDGAILRTQIKQNHRYREPKKSNNKHLAFQRCVHAALKKFRFPGFTPGLTTAAVTFRIPANR